MRRGGGSGGFAFIQTGDRTGRMPSPVSTSRQMAQQVRVDPLAAATHALDTIDDAAQQGNRPRTPFVGRHREDVLASYLLDGAANGSAGVNGTPNMDAGVNRAADLGGQRCGKHEDRGDSTNYRKLAEHKIATCPVPFQQPS